MGTVTYNSAVAVSHTGNTNETTLATVTIPAGLLQSNSVIEIYSLFTGTNGAVSDINPRVYFGGTKYMEDALNTNASHQSNVTICCNNSITSQKGFPSPGSAVTYGGALITSAVNTAQPVDIVFTGQLANAADTVALQGYRIKLNGV